MKNLNEGLLDSVGISKDISDKKSVPNFKTKKIVRSSIFDTVNSEISPIQTNDIFIPKTISEYKQQKFVENIQEKSFNQLKIEALTKKAKIREGKVNINIQNNIQTISNQEKNVSQIQDLLQIPIVDVNKQLIETYEELTETKLPDGIDLEAVVEEIQDSAELIPGMDNLSITDFEINTTVGKEGYTKNLVTIKSEIGGSELSKIATIVKKATDGIVLHRAMTTLTIANGNKTQLRDSKYKMYPISYVFNPVANQNVIKPVKFRRIIISIPMEFNTSKRVLLFIQDSRSKFVTELNFDLEFISKIISDYFIVGFEATKARLKTSGINDPFNLLINKLMLTRKFLINPIFDEETNSISEIIVKTKNGKHQWLGINISKKKIFDSYDVHCMNKADYSWDQKYTDSQLKGKSPNIEYLLSQRFEDNLTVMFNEYDWKKFGVSEEDEDNRQLYLLNKLSYKSLKNAFIEIYDLQTENEENSLGIFIKEALSKLDTAKDINSEYAAEVIVGKTNYLDYFILSWSAILINGGDKRNGKDYTTTSEYYEKHGTLDRETPYPQRRGTVPKKQNSDRNYNSRPFMFTLTYSTGGKEKTIQAKTFVEIKDLSNFLTSNPK